MNNINIILNPIVSVVIPCYNVEKYIRRGLDSIIAQTLQEWEAILVDDGATDSTGRICDEYAAKDRRFHVIHQKNQGVSCARNNGMKDANGELLYFMDPDDWIEPNCFEFCYEAYQQYHCDIVHFGFWWCYEGKEKFSSKDNTFSISEGDDIYKNYTSPLAGFSQEALNHYFKGEFIWNYKNDGQVWSYMFSKSFVLENDLRFPSGITIYEDGLFLVEATYKAKIIVKIPDIFYYYIQRDGSVINQKKNSQRLYDYKFRHILERQRLRAMIKEFDLHDSYLGTHVLSCMQLALLTSDVLKNYKQFRKYVCHLAIQESIRKVSIKNAPLKFSVPVRMLKTHCHLLLFIGCWLLHKIGLSQRFTM